MAQRGQITQELDRQRLTLVEAQLHNLRTYSTCYSCVFPNILATFWTHTQAEGLCTFCRTIIIWYYLYCMLWHWTSTTLWFLSIQCGEFQDENSYPIKFLVLVSFPVKWICISAANLVDWYDFAQANKTATLAACIGNLEPTWAKPANDPAQGACPHSTVWRRESKKARVYEFFCQLLQSWKKTWCWSEILAFVGSPSKEPPSNSISNASSCLLAEVSHLLMLSVPKTLQQEASGPPHNIWEKTSPKGTWPRPCTFSVLSETTAASRSSAFRQFFT